MADLTLVSAVSTCKAAEATKALQMQSMKPGSNSNSESANMMRNNFKKPKSTKDKTVHR